VNLGSRRREKAPAVFVSHGFPRSQHRQHSAGPPPFTRTDAPPAPAADSGPHLRTRPPIREEEPRRSAPAYFPRRPARAGRPPPRAQTAPPAPAADSGPHCIRGHLSGTRAPLPLTRAPLPLPRGQAARSRAPPLRGAPEAPRTPGSAEKQGTGGRF
jgi:hypothetical protein